MLNLNCFQRFFDVLNIELMKWWKSLYLKPRYAKTPCSRQTLKLHKYCEYLRPNRARAAAAASRSFHFFQTIWHLLPATFILSVTVKLARLNVIVPYRTVPRLKHNITTANSADPTDDLKLISPTLRGIAVVKIP